MAINENPYMATATVTPEYSNRRGMQGEINEIESSRSSLSQMGGSFSQTSFTDSMIMQNFQGIRQARTEKLRGKTARAKGELTQFFNTASLSDIEDNTKASKKFFDTVQEHSKGLSLDEGKKLAQDAKEHFNYGMHTLYNKRIQQKNQQADRIALNHMDRTLTTLISRDATLDNFPTSKANIKTQADIFSTETPDTKPVYFERALSKIYNSDFLVKKYTGKYVATYGALPRGMKEAYSSNKAFENSVYAKKFKVSSKEELRRIADMQIASRDLYVPVSINKDVVAQKTQQLSPDYLPAQDYAVAFLSKDTEALMNKGQKDIVHEDLAYTSEVIKAHTQVLIDGKPMRFDTIGREPATQASFVAMEAYNGVKNKSLSVDALTDTVKKVGDATTPLYKQELADLFVKSRQATGGKPSPSDIIAVQKKYMRISFMNGVSTAFMQAKERASTRVFNRSERYKKLEEERNAVVANVKF